MTPVRVSRPPVGLLMTTAADFFFSMATVSAVRFTFGTRFGRVFDGWVLAFVAFAASYRAFLPAILFQAFPSFSTSAGVVATSYSFAASLPWVFGSAVSSAIVLRAAFFFLFFLFAPFDFCPSYAFPIGSTASIWTATFLLTILSSALEISSFYRQQGRSQWVLFLR